MTSISTCASTIHGMSPSLAVSIERSASSVITAASFSLGIVVSLTRHGVHIELQTGCAASFLRNKGGIWKGH